MLVAERGFRLVRDARLGEYRGARQTGMGQAFIADPAACSRTGLYAMAGAMPRGRGLYAEYRGVAESFCGPHGWIRSALGVSPAAAIIAGPIRLRSETAKPGIWRRPVTAAGMPIDDRRANGSACRARQPGGHDRLYPAACRSQTGRIGRPTSGGDIAGPGVMQ